MYTRAQKLEMNVIGATHWYANGLSKNKFKRLMVMCNQIYPSRDSLIAMGLDVALATQTVASNFSFAMGNLMGIGYSHDLYKDVLGWIQPSESTRLAWQKYGF